VEPGSKAPDGSAINAGSVCMGRYVGFGQNTSSVWCRQDSCFAVRHARNENTAAPVGYYAGKNGPDRYQQARGLASQAIAKKDWRMTAGVSSIRVMLDDTLERTISWHPANTSALDALDDWKEGTMDSLLPHPVWSDSLVLKIEGGRDSSDLYLASGKTAQAWLGKDTDVSLLLGFKASVPDSQVTLDAECARKLITGGRCAHIVPKGTRRIKAIVRAYARDGSLGPAKACLDGRFELNSEWVETRTHPKSTGNP
jgi:hypothetical protein